MAEPEAEGAGEAEREGVGGVCERERRLRRTVDASSGARQWQCVSKRSGSAASAAAGLRGATDAVDAGAFGVVSGLRGGFMCGSRWARARRAEGKKGTCGENRGPSAVSGSTPLPVGRRHTKENM